jgi:hypothetical protein
VIFVQVNAGRAFGSLTAGQSCAAQNFSAQENLELLRPVEFQRNDLLPRRIARK